MNNTELNMDKKYSMKVVSMRTGLSAHAIRAWERRYNAVSPKRDSNNRRYYTEEDIDRLLLLKRVTDAGFGISQVVNSSEEELKNLLDTMNVIDLPIKQDLDQKTRTVANENSFENYVESFMNALEQMNSKALENILIQAETDYGLNGVIENVLVPIMEEVGEGWRKGNLRISHEHLASHVIRTFLGGILASHKTSPSAPNVLVTTPADQWHDIGALMIAVTAASEGWNVTYLGANLPSQEIAGAVKQNNCKAVILSIVYPEDDPVLVQEIRKLRRTLPDNVTIIVGGRASTSYKAVLDEIDALRVDSLYEIRTSLESLRSKK
ncbi:MAG: MerR family transcriptional regulator [Thermodesulfobacteriota bacterium]|nr:MAG: MerR family transcriptional regulator [Thermodesulfobacteriota bacterium]